MQGRPGTVAGRRPDAARNPPQQRAGGAQGGRARTALNYLGPYLRARRMVGDDAGATLQQSGARGGGSVGPPRAPRPQLPGALFTGAPHGGGCGGRAPRGITVAEPSGLPSAERAPGRRLTREPAAKNQTNVRTRYTLPQSEREWLRAERAPNKNR